MNGLEAGDLGEWPLWINAGKEQLVIPASSPAAVRRARPKPELFSKLKSEGVTSVIFSGGGSAPSRRQRTITVDVLPGWS